MKSDLFQIQKKNYFRKIVKMVKKNTCVFISGKGSNLKNLINKSRDYNFPINVRLCNLQQQRSQRNNLCEKKKKFNSLHSSKLKK